jgi:hypothetical protein
MPEDKDDDLFDTVSAMADRLKLKDGDRRTYIHEHMTRGGYRAEPTYVRDDKEDEDEDEGGSGFFGKSRSRDSQRGSSRDDRGSRDSGRTRNRRGDDSWYS